MLVLDCKNWSIHSFDSLRYIVVGNLQTNSNSIVKTTGGIQNSGYIQSFHHRLPFIYVFVCSIRESKSEKWEFLRI
ncbi:hypothetical protein L1887_00196 [Cichorium endivia]|nr:hypothetical protein L1887_00196 [Cichorium endivia]